MLGLRRVAEWWRSRRAREFYSRAERDPHALIAREQGRVADVERVAANELTADARRRQREVDALRALIAGLDQR